MTVAFELDGLKFTALNGGPRHKFTPALSLIVNCHDQAEIDRLWDKLAEGGEHVQCGWLTDKYGLTWQIVPTVLLDMMKDQNGERKERVMKAMFKMTKLDIAGLEEAHRSR